MKYSHPYLILGRKSRMIVELKAGDYYTMQQYHENLIEASKRLRKCLKRTKLEWEADKVETWLKLNENLKYAA